MQLHAILPNINANPERLKEYFPTYLQTKPIASRKKLKTSDETVNAEPNTIVDTKKKSLTEPIEKLINLDYMSNTLRVLRSFPLSEYPKNYLSWLAKIENHKAQTWKEMEIFDMIQLSKVGLVYCQPILIISLYFWNNTHKNFQFPCGMLTPTLFDVAAITSLRPTGDTFDPNYMTKETIGFNGSQATFTRCILDHHNKDTKEVSEEKHISFLALWPSRCVFCSKYLQVAKKFLTMANQLHAGHKLCIIQMVLGYLYESLGEGDETYKNIKLGSSLLLAGSYWLLQLWPNSTFETSLPTHNTINKEPDDIKNRRVEGTRLIQLTPNDEGLNL